jgi:hypothetical protein
MRMYRMRLGRSSGRFLSRAHVDEAPEFEVITYGELYEVLRHLPADARLYVPILEEIDWEDASEEERVDFLDYFGKKSTALTVIPIPGVNLDYLTMPLADILAEHPSRAGVLSILSAVTQAGERPDVPSFLLDPDRYIEPQLREAAILVRLVQNTLNQSEGELLAESLCKLAENRPEVYDSCLTVIDQHNLTGSAIEAFLLEILEALPKQEWPTQTKVIQSLNNSLRRRTSRLNEVWSELKLPHDLQHLIRT